MTGWTDEARQASIEARQGGKGKGDETHHHAAQQFNKQNVANLMHQNWTGMSAARPGLNTKIKEQAAMSALARDIANRGGSSIAARGTYYGDKENSLMVSGISARAGVQLGSKYQQQSVINKSGVRFASGSQSNKLYGMNRYTRINRATGGITTGHAARSGDNTYVPQTGSRFRVGTKR